MSQPNACGGCTACCTVMKVEMDPVKPAGERCRHCVKGGCAIYDARPEPCQVWSCVWLLSQEKPENRLASAMRPDRAGVVLEVNSAQYIVAHCATPAAWQREPMRRWLIGRAGKTRVLIDAGGDMFLLSADGSTEALQFAGVDPATNERQYRTKRAVFQ